MWTMPTNCNCLYLYTGMSISMILTHKNSGQVSRSWMIDQVQTTICVMALYTTYTYTVHFWPIDRLFYEQHSQCLPHNSSRQTVTFHCQTNINTVTSSWRLYTENILISTIPDGHADSDWRLSVRSSSSLRLFIRRKLPNLFMGTSRPHVRPEDQPYPPNCTTQRSCSDSRELNTSKSQKQMS